MIRTLNKELKLKLSLFQSRWHIGGSEVWLHSFLKSAVGAGEWSKSRHYSFTHVKEQKYPSNKKLVGFQGRFGRVRTLRNLAAVGIRNMDPIARSLFVIMTTQTRLLPT